jgi:hypothetical protein
MQVGSPALRSAGERSFVSAALGYFDICARSYHDFVWFEIGGLRAPQESWVAFDRRLTTFSMATITGENAERIIDGKDVLQLEHPSNKSSTAA